MSPTERACSTSAAPSPSTQRTGTSTTSSMLFAPLRLDVEANDTDCPLFLCSHQMATAVKVAEPTELWPRLQVSEPALVECA